MLNYGGALLYMAGKEPANIVDIYLKHKFPESSILAAIMNKPLPTKTVPISAINKAEEQIDLIPLVIDALSKLGKNNEIVELCNKLYFPSYWLECFPGIEGSYNINLQALRGELDPVIGRDKEIAEVTQIINNRKKRNPVLVGDAGVGKTAIVEGLAARINNRQVPITMLNKTIMSIDISEFVEAANGLDKFRSVLSRCEEMGNIILFIDEFHQIANARRMSGINLVDMFKPALARGNLAVIAATTEDEYRRVEKDKAMARRMQTVYVKEPTLDETNQILRSVYPIYEKTHNVQISDNVLDLITKASVNVPGYNPDKAITILDGVLSMAKTKNNGIPKSIDNNEVVDIIVNRYKVRKAFLMHDESYLAFGETLKSKLPIYADKSNDIMNTIITAHSKQNKSHGASSVSIVTGIKGATLKIAKAISETLDPDEKYMIINGSEFSSEVSMTRLTGAPPAYIGHESPSMFMPVKQRPMPIVITDFQMIHPKNAAILTKMIEDGFIETTAHEIISFKNVDFVITTTADGVDGGFVEGSKNIDKQLTRLADIIIEARKRPLSEFDEILSKYDKTEDDYMDRIDEGNTVEELEKILTEEKHITKYIS